MARELDVFLERWRNHRERLLSSPRFQRWAAAFPLTRPVARRRASQLFDLCAGFVYSQTLLACVQLKIFERLRGQPQTVARIAEFSELPLSATARLVDAAIVLGLLERRSNDRIGLGPHGAALIANEAVVGMIEHHPMLYTDLRDPVALLRGQISPTELSRFWAYAQSSDPTALAAEQIVSYSRLMSISQPLVASDILDAYPLDKHRCLLDVGGGEGVFALSAAARHSHLRCMVFDIPAVAARAELRFAEAGWGDRAVAVGGDFRVDALPLGADVISLVRVVHDHDDMSVARLLRAAYEALQQSGTLLVAEPLSGTAAAERVGAAYFGFYLLAMGCGQPRTATQLMDLIRGAGFVHVRELRTQRPLQVRVVAAQKATVN